MKIAGILTGSYTGMCGASGNFSNNLFEHGSWYRQEERAIPPRDWPPLASLSVHPNKLRTMYFAIEGVIGVGKTTLARLLQPVFGAELLLEVFEENPFLSDFYADRERYAFQTQIFFLLSRYHQQRQSVPEALARRANLIGDYTFEKDSLFASINLVGDELEMYYRVHEALAEKIPPPDLIVYLRADTDVLMQRIAMRDRPYERNMERDYIDELNRCYEAFYGQRQDGPRSAVLTIDTNQLDYVRDPEALKWVENRIRQSLRLVPFQAELPLGIEPADNQT